MSRRSFKTYALNERLLMVQAFVQGIGLSEQVGMKTLTLRVAHVAAEVLEHVAVGSL